jgi:hypothetical protein
MTQPQVGTPWQAAGSGLHSCVVVEEPGAGPPEVWVVTQTSSRPQLLSPQVRARHWACETQLHPLSFSCSPSLQGTSHVAGSTFVQP